MSYKEELSNLKEPNEARFFTRLVNECTQNSEYTLTAGAPSDAYIDIDRSVMIPELAVDLANTVSEKIKQLISIGHHFDKIAFIEETNGGPVGMINLHSSIVGLLNKESIIIRPQKELIRDSIKGKIKEGDRIMIINDIATTGETIFKSAEKVWKFGAKVPYALVVIDRLQGAKENLFRKGITLFSLVSTKSINENLKEGIKKQYELSTPILKDFGGTSVTFVK